ncbi:MAG TPA: sulfatase-like hydrolase/transferase [Longimicrobium sp.]|jgi:hypothetical protein|nr:sulfatase-like hydrolase/transferase [Longimicrobium sp.]
MKIWRELRLAVFPVLAAVYPALSLAAGNAAAGVPDRLVRTVLAAAAAGAALWALSALLTRDPDRRMLVALAGVVWFSGYGAWERAARGTLLAPRALALSASLLLLAAAVAWVARTRRGLATPARIARATAVLVLAFPLFTLAMQPRPAVAKPAQPGRTMVHPVADSLPSIYLIILDKYTGTRSLAANHGYDNTPFEARLREMGFTVGRGAATNYPHTWLSLPSMLNWEPVDSILAGRPQREWMTALRTALDDNRTARFLRERGYEYVFVPSGFPFTSTSSLADRVVGAPRRHGMDLWAAWAAETPLRMLPARHAGSRGRPPPFPSESGREMEKKLQTIAALADGRRPRFVFAHLLLPHEPFIFRADCTHREPYWPTSEYGEEGQAVRAAYLEQVSCTSRLVERMVADILRRSAVPPVILLQADHGHGFVTLETATGSQLPRARLRPGQAEERMDAFAAYYLPGGGAAGLYEGMTAVNLMPVVLNHYLDAGIPLREDRVYWATLHPPFNLERIR